MLSGQLESNQIPAGLHVPTCADEKKFNVFLMYLDWLVISFKAKKQKIAAFGSSYRRPSPKR